MKIHSQKLQQISYQLQIIKMRDPDKTIGGFNSFHLIKQFMQNIFIERVDVDNVNNIENDKSNYYDSLQISQVEKGKIIFLTISKGEAKYYDKFSTFNTQKKHQQIDCLQNWYNKQKQNNSFEINACKYYLENMKDILKKKMKFDSQQNQFLSKTKSFFNKFKSQFFKQNQKTLIQQSMQSTSCLEQEHDNIMASIEDSNMIKGIKQGQSKHQ